ncbi:MAG: hypothetical protein ABSE99_02590 [Terracidiphilus sp.]
MRDFRFAASVRTFSRLGPYAALQALGLVLLLALPGGAQNPNGGAPPVTGPSYQRPSGFGPFDDTGSAEEEKRLRALNAERQKSMVADAAKLLKLAGELNSDVNGAAPGTLTPEQLRKAGEIEKLAHNVKEKMSTSVRTTPVFLQTPHPGMR